MNGFVLSLGRCIYQTDQARNRAQLVPGLVVPVEPVAKVYFLLPRVQVLPRVLHGRDALRDRVHLGGERQLRVHGVAGEVPLVGGYDPLGEDFVGSKLVSLAGFRDWDLNKKGPCEKRYRMVPSKPKLGTFLFW